MSKQSQRHEFDNGAVMVAAVAEEGGAVRVTYYPGSEAVLERGCQCGSITLEQARYHDLWKISDDVARHWVSDAMGLDHMHELVEFVDWTLFAMQHPKRQS